MNKSYFSDTEEDQNELLIYLMNSLFDVFSMLKLETLNMLLDQTKIKSLILEIEPLFEAITGPLELTLNDLNFGIRYANMVSIISAFDIYFKSKLVSDKLKYTDKFNIKENIKVNDLLKGDSKNLQNFAEIFMLLSAITSQKDIYIDRISESEEKYLNGYLDIVETYIVFNDDNKSVNTGTRKFTTRTSLLFGYNDNNKTMLAIEKLSKKILELENIKKAYLKTINQNEQDLEEYQLKNKSLSTSVKEYEAKVIDLEREIEMLKRQNDDNIKAYQDMYQDILNIDQLKKQIGEKDFEIEKINQEHKNQIRNYLSKISKLEGTILNLKEKDDEYKSISAENERLKSKNKEFQYLKERVANYDELLQNIDKQNFSIENLNFEKTALQSQLDKYTTEIFAEREKNRTIELDKEKSLFKIEELQNYIESLKSAYDKKTRPNTSILKRAQSIFIPDLSEESNDNKKFVEIGRDELMKEIEKAVEERTIQFMKEMEELRNERNAVVKSLREETLVLKEEKENLQYKIEELKKDINEYITAKDRLIVEKEKIELFYQKNEVEFKKTIFNLEKEHDIIETENSKNLIKLSELNNIKEVLSKELNALKDNHAEITFQNDLLTKSKNEFVNDYNTLKSEMRMMKEKFENEILILKKENQREKEKLSVKENELKKYLSKGNINTNQQNKNFDFSNEKQYTIPSFKINKEPSVNVVDKNDNNNLHKNNTEAVQNNATHNKNELMDYSQNGTRTNSNSIILTQNSEYIEAVLNNLKNEIENLKTTLNKKEDSIKFLNGKIRDLEKENKSLLSQLHENLEKFNGEIKQREEDLDFLRRAYDEQKNKMNREHQMVNSSLYELALQFMTAKQELNKKHSPVRKISEGNKKLLSNFSLNK